MFTGIVEEMGEVVALEPQGANRVLRIRSGLSSELRVDQSVAHDGVCLTVTAVRDGVHEVVAVKETLDRTTLGALAVGDPVNLERSLRLGDRLDGHMVQGHVDGTVTCTDMSEEGGSWRFRFSMPPARHLLVEKGSICINGVSLTVASLDDVSFAVAIIPYTFKHTTFERLLPGRTANIEYDVLGKYVERMLRR